MVLATSLVALPAVLFLAVFRGREVCASRTRAFLLASVVWTLAVYTFFRVDTPFNYYASRYYAPVLVPSALLLLGTLLGHFPRARGALALLALLGIAFNLYFDRLFLRYPSESEKLRFVQEVAERVGGDRVLFVRGEARLHQLLALTLGSLHGIPVVRVAHLRGESPLPLIERYAARLGLGGAAVLSAVPPEDGRPSEVMEVVERRLPQRVQYPTEYFERPLRYYLYDVVTGTSSGSRSPGS
jgi:hypothetical protein